MSTSRLSLYNGALLEVGERDLASLTENREPRRLLDRAWDNGLVDYCLKQGQWTFAKRTKELAPSTSVSPAFKYRNAFDKPTDFIRTRGMYSDEQMQVGLLHYGQEGNYFLADEAVLYLDYVSNDENYGGNLASWPSDFVRAVEVYLASRIVKKLTQSADDESALFKKAHYLLEKAASADAMEGPPKFPPDGSWVRARRGGAGRDGGNRGSLVG